MRSLFNFLLQNIVFLVTKRLDISSLIHVCERGIKQHVNEWNKSDELFLSKAQAKRNMIW